MKQLLKISEMMPYLPAALKDAIHHVAKDTGNATDALELHRHTHSEKAKVNELDPSSRKSLAYVSYRTQDRDDEIVIPKSLKLDEFRKYSSVLVNHNYSLLPVGSDEWIDADDFGIKALTVHADTGAGTMANVVWDLVRQGHLKGRSVGFVPTSYTKPGARDWDHVANQLQSNWKEFDKGRAEKSVSRIITGGVLLEHSFVSVPCNTDAELIGVVKSMNLDGKIIKQLGLEDKPAEKVPSVCDECGYVADAVPGSKCPECKTGDMKPKSKEKVIEVRVVSKGGPGSGNFGHEGRPGEVGGSGPGGGGGNGDGDKGGKGSEGDWKRGAGPTNPKDAMVQAERAIDTVPGMTKYDIQTGYDSRVSGKEGEVTPRLTIRGSKLEVLAVQSLLREVGYSTSTDMTGEGGHIYLHGLSAKSFHSHAVEKPNAKMPGGSFSACVLLMEDKGHSTESAKKICGALQAESGEKLYDIIAEEVINKEVGDGRGRMGGPYSAGPGGACKCPECGHEQKHEVGKPCTEVKCAKCGAAMARKEMGEEKKEHTPEIKLIRPAPSVKILFAPPTGDMIAAQVGEAVERALSRRTGKIL